MPDDTLQKWEKEAERMRGRPLTKDEKAAYSEEIVRGTVHPDMDPRRRKRIMRTALNSVRPGKKVRAS